MVEEVTQQEIADLVKDADLAAQYRYAKTKQGKRELLHEEFDYTAQNELANALLEMAVGDNKRDDLDVKINLFEGKEEKGNLVQFVVDGSSLCVPEDKLDSVLLEKVQYNDISSIDSYLNEDRWKHDLDKKFNKRELKEDLAELNQDIRERLGVLYELESSSREGDVANMLQPESKSQPVLQPKPQRDGVGDVGALAPVDVAQEEVTTFPALKRPDDYQPFKPEEIQERIDDVTVFLGEYKDTQKELRGKSTDNNLSEDVRAQNKQSLIENAEAAQRYFKQLKEEGVLASTEAGQKALEEFSDALAPKKIASHSKGVTKELALASHVRQ